jgi:hypothetical protein
LKRGLKLINRNGNIEWSTEELNRVYGKASISELPESERVQIKALVHEIIEAALGYELACVTPNEMGFLSREKKTLDGGQK